MADGTFVQIAPVALPTAQGTVRGTVITAVYALDSLGNLWKLTDHLGQKWMRVTAEREGYCSQKIEEKERSVNVPHLPGGVTHLACAQKVAVRTAPQR